MEEKMAGRRFHLSHHDMLPFLSTELIPASSLKKDFLNIYIRENLFLCRSGTRTGGISELDEFLWSLSL